MPIAIEKVRAETPGCQHVAHFNNAGAALMPSPVFETVANYQLLEATIGGYEAGAKQEEQLQNFYNAAARLVKCHPSEIAFVENATRAWDMAFYSLKFSPGDKILTDQAAYASSYIAFLQLARQKGVLIEVIPDDEHGQISVSELEKRIDSRVKLIAITHIPTQGGLVNPAEAVGKIARQAGIFYLLDATQSAGQMPLDVSQLGCNAMCATGRKFLRGPRGTGFLYVDKASLLGMEPVFLDLHAATWAARDHYTIQESAMRFETWECNYANKLGLAAAIDYALSMGLEAIWQQVQKLAAHLREALSNISGLKLRDLGLQKCGIVTFTLDGIDPNTIMLKLREQAINVSVSVQEYARLDLEARKIPSLVRASVHYYNTEEEISRLCQALERIKTL